MTLSIAIVGCGAVAQRLYLEPLRQLERRGILRVAALVDPQPAHVRALQRAFRQAKSFDDLSEVWKQGTIDLTLILTPAHLHALQAAAALSHGSHVLCEKPMAMNVADCDSMNAAAREAKRVLAIGMIRRFFPAVATLRSLLHSGQLGDIQSFDYREGRRFDWEVTTPAAFRRRSEGGTGVLFDIGPHALDVLGWVFGDLEIVSYADDALAGVESNAAIEVDSPICPGRVQLSWDFPLANELRIGGSKGQAVLRLDQFDRLATNAPGRWEEVSLDAAFPGGLEAASTLKIIPRDYGAAITCQLIQTIRAIQLHEAPAVDGEAGRRCVALLEAALAMARPLDMPWLAHEQQEAYRSLHWTSAP